MKKTAIAFTVAALAAAAAFSGPLGAAKQLKPAPVRIDQQLGYVVARIGPAANARGHGAIITLARIDPAHGAIRTRSRSDANAVPRGEDASARIGGRRSFTEGGETGTFVTSLTPGEWVIQATVTTCFCLGSYRFTVAAGEIVDIGTILIARADGLSDVPALRAHKISDDLLQREWLVPDVMLVQPAAEGASLPPQLAGLPVRRAELVADARFDNATGLLLNRAAGLPDFVSSSRPEFRQPEGGRVGWPGIAASREQQNQSGSSQPPRN